VIILIDGEFRQNLSPWHKELVYALQYPGVKAIYGGSSMGALRAAELDYLGMIGIGRIYEWYRDGVTEDDAEVALSYAVREGWHYYPLTVPLCDIRSGVQHYLTQFEGQPEIITSVNQFFRVMQATHYMDRTPRLCEETWGRAHGIAYPIGTQKANDAFEVLANFSHYQPEVKVQPTVNHLSVAFQALYDRDRKIDFRGQQIAQQNVDSYCLLHNPEYERICWDSANQELALILCNCLFVMVTLEEVTRESDRFQQRCGIENMADFESMLRGNGWTRGEYDRLMVQNARIHKLQHALTVSKHSKRNTAAICDYLRTHQAFDYWAKEAAQVEAAIEKSGVDEWSSIDLEVPVWTRLANHFEEEGLELKSSHEEYLLETGFSNANELTVALSRLRAQKE
jgi:hypothetical protein